MEKNVYHTPSRNKMKLQLKASQKCIERMSGELSSLKARVSHLEKERSADAETLSMLIDKISHLI